MYPWLKAALTRLLDAGQPRSAIGASFDTEGDPNLGIELSLGDRHFGGTPEPVRDAGPLKCPRIADNCRRVRGARYVRVWEMPLGWLNLREVEIFTRVSQGLSNAEISQLSLLSEAAVKLHVRVILQKLNLRSRIQIVVFACENNLVWCCVLSILRRAVGESARILEGSRRIPCASGIS